MERGLAPLKAENEHSYISFIDGMISSSDLPTSITRQDQYDPVQSVDLEKITPSPSLACRCSNWSLGWRLGRRSGWDASLELTRQCPGSIRCKCLSSSWQKTISAIANGAS
ncbi:uncharacterized protein LOC112342197 [Selaginella moellendorffii]|uniref:uncharacterized protein LOC112342197 n=1 Tax=Selaginella moellendorffii TaxID=88036 RepID=UPI000D1C25F5|nr:uncharacterized protein LOC112342197 [Selaginella moellendorffii]|eukprot:XP_024519400.1 uncharacterized protein LOC112342197 [Selaginella moellendorffii]